MTTTTITFRADIGINDSFGIETEFSIDKEKWDAMSEYERAALVQEWAISQVNCWYEEQE